MSGGSFNYLYERMEHGDIIPSLQAMEHMCKELDDLGHKDARDAFQDLINTGKAFERKAQRLANIAHAIEWWTDGDYGEDGVKEAVEKLPVQEPHDKQRIHQHICEAYYGAKRAMEMGAPWAAGDPS